MTMKLFKADNKRSSFAQFYNYFDIDMNLRQFFTYLFLRIVSRFKSLSSISAITRKSTQIQYDGKIINVSA